MQKLNFLVTFQGYFTPYFNPEHEFDVNFSPQKIELPENIHSRGINIRFIKFLIIGVTSKVILDDNIHFDYQQKRNECIFYYFILLL